ncbi:MAG: GNAT family N-acetyltransferase [Carbonactinosporaceae bacterium]
MVRDARQDDYPAVGEITVSAYLADGLLHNDHGYAAQLRDARHRAEHAELIVAADPPTGRLLGSVTFCLPGSTYAEQSREGEAEFRMLAVAPDARGHGAGEALVLECLLRARARGCVGVVISTLRSMHTAHRLYERLGFRRVPGRDWWPVPEIELLCFARSF